MDNSEIIIVVLVLVVLWILWDRFKFQPKQEENNERLKMLEFLQRICHTFEIKQNPHYTFLENMKLVEREMGAKLGILMSRDLEVIERLTNQLSLDDKDNEEEEESDNPRLNFAKNMEKKDKK